MFVSNQQTLLKVGQYIFLSLFKNKNSSQKLAVSFVTK